jgi:hypothetical protein
MGKVDTKIPKKKKIFKKHNKPRRKMDNLNGVETPRINDEPTTYRNSKV